jgi:hypothetical protein
MKPLSKKVRDLVGMPGAVPESKKVVEQVVEVDLKAVEKKVVKQLSLKQICQNCKGYNRKTKLCMGTGGKYVPRKGTCEAFDKVKQ